ncbi:MAG: hypothetical protein A2888_02925 [Chlamydiae bacterium RIFCSPLOWO2_01_FULL_28_7]|nr:MAG: hypothetical protein A2888_02925 [Chlamydiae bacterium RIFCSPLOWO2_01_FULL_28_7]
MTTPTTTTPLPQDVSVSLTPIEQIDINGNQYNLRLEQRVNGVWQEISIPPEQIEQLKDYFQESIKGQDTKDSSRIVIEYKLKGQEIDVDQTVSLITYDKDGKETNKTILYKKDETDPNKQTAYNTFLATIKKTSVLFQQIIPATSTGSSHAAPAAPITPTGKKSEYNLCWSHALLSGFKSLDPTNFPDPSDKTLASAIRTKAQFERNAQQSSSEAITILNGSLTNQQIPLINVTIESSQNIDDLIKNACTTAPHGGFGQIINSVSSTPFTPGFLVIDTNRLFQTQGMTQPQKSIKKVNFGNSFNFEACTIEIQKKYLAKSEPNSGKLEELETYEITAVTVHEGQSGATGHYVTYVKENNEWYSFNNGIKTGNALTQKEIKEKLEDGAMFFLKKEGAVVDLKATKEHITS